MIFIKSLAIYFKWSNILYKFWTLIAIFLGDIGLLKPSNLFQLACKFFPKITFLGDNIKVETKGVNLDDVVL